MSSPMLQVNPMIRPSGNFLSPSKAVVRLRASVLCFHSIIFFKIASQKVRRCSARVDRRELRKDIFNIPDAQRAAFNHSPVFANTNFVIFETQLHSTRRL